MQDFEFVVVGGGIVGLSVLSLKREGYHRTSFDLRDFLDTVTYPGFWRLVGTPEPESKRSSFI